MHHQRMRHVLPRGDLELAGGARLCAAMTDAAPAAAGQRLGSALCRMAAVAGRTVHTWLGWCEGRASVDEVVMCVGFGFLLGFLVALALRQRWLVRARASEIE